MSGAHPFPRCLLGAGAVEEVVVGVIEEEVAASFAHAALEDAGFPPDRIRLLTGEQVLRLGLEAGEGSEEDGEGGSLEGEPQADEEYLAVALLGDVPITADAGGRGGAGRAARVLSRHGARSLRRYSWGVIEELTDVGARPAGTVATGRGAG